MISEIVHGELVAKREGLYTIYVFRIDNGEFRMCTKLPNWGPYNLQIGDSGFVTLRSYEAGEEFYNRNTESNQIIKFTNVYFIEFVEDSVKGTDIILLILK